MELAKRLSATAITSGMLNSPNRKVKLQNTDCSHVLPPHQILMLPVQPAIRMKSGGEVWHPFFAEFCFLSGFLQGRRAVRKSAGEVVNPPQNSVWGLGF